jgi:heterodisulfide reductase subunit C
VIEATPGGERLVHCLQCGSCGGSCPSGADMEYTPRTLIAMINADDRDAVLAANTMWACVSCYFCTTRCPQNIPITDIIYPLKRMSIAEHRYKNTDAPALAKTFTDLVERYGRAYEVGIALFYLGMNKPLSALKAGPMGISMFFKGRMAILPQKIRQIDQLQAIIKKARQIGGAA